MFIAKMGFSMGFFNGVHEGGKLYCIHCGHDVREQEDCENDS